MLVFSLQSTQSGHTTLTTLLTFQPTPGVQFIYRFFRLNLLIYFMLHDIDQAYAYLLSTSRCTVLPPLQWKLHDETSDE